MPKGGKRPGAGRKKTAPPPLPRVISEEAKALIESHEAALVQNLIDLANGGYERTEQVWKPAGSIYIDVEMKDRKGQVKVDRGGRPIRRRVKAYPKLPADQLVLVETKVSVADRDRAANVYLLDRLRGRPAQSVQATDPNGAPVKAYIGFDADEV